ncbi:MAG: HPr family phosphocarrier protein [Neobacillus sp.]
MKFGIQAQKATEFVTKSAQFNSDIYILKEGKVAACKSIMGVMCFAIRKGEKIVLRADGLDEVEAIRVLEAFLMVKN